MTLAFVGAQRNRLDVNSLDSIAYIEALMQ